MNISIQLTENPGLIALIDKPTEEDLLKVIYSKNILDSIIRDLPDEYITPKVATIALCLTKKWGKESLNIWFDKFYPHVLPEDQLKVFKSIYSYLPVNPWNGKDIDLFIEIFSKVNNPAIGLIDYYLDICSKNMYLGLGYYRKFEDIEFYLIDKPLTKNMQGILKDYQQRVIIDAFIDTHIDLNLNTWISVNNKELLDSFSDIRVFIPNTDLYNKGKEHIYACEKKAEDNKKEYEEAHRKPIKENKRWWQKYQD